MKKKNSGKTKTKQADGAKPENKAPAFRIQVLKYVAFDIPKTFKESRSLWSWDEMQGDGVVLVSLFQPGGPNQLRVLSATNELGGICDDCVDHDLMGSMISGYAIARISEVWL